MGTFNEITLIGRLGRDPEMRYTSNGKAVTNFSICTERGRSDEVDWHNIVCWEKTAEAANQYLQKGHQVCVVGQLQYDKYEKDGQKVTRTQILANRIVFLERVKKVDGPSVPSFDEA